MTLLNQKYFAWISTLSALTVLGCSTLAPTSEKNAFVAEINRVLASKPVLLSASPRSSTDFGRQMRRLGLNSYFANLHAHHFMDVRGSKKNPLTLEEALAAGPCKVEHGTFPMDDGRPCRDEGGAENITIQPRTKLADGSPDTSDYFKQACEYATEKGGLDILFVTPHTKNNGLAEGQVVTSTSSTEMTKRQEMLAAINPDRLTTPKHLCGLGQEASSISAGNHINIFGQFHAGKSAEEAFFFPTGDFKTLYSAIKAKNAAGGGVFLQMNHPGVKRDLYWGDLATFGENKRRKKEALNDYGLDDFGPLGCLTGKVAPAEAECAGVPESDLTPELLQQTFANIRAASGDPFRLIEVVSPGNSKEEGEDTDGDGTPDTEGKEGFSATTNSRETFRSVQNRNTPDSYEDGIYDWIFYLSMGFKIGPTANQDNHHMNWGSATASRTGVIASNLKEETVLDALRSRHVFASEDKNASVLLSEKTGRKTLIMGDTRKTNRSNAKIKIAYYDPDGQESTAKVRLYYYRATDVLYGKGLPSKGTYRTVSFGGKNQITLPAVDAQERSANDLIPIRSGEVLSLNLPLAKGTQWIFAEIIQDSDLDKIWTAPLWIDRK